MNNLFDHKEYRVALAVGSLGLLALIGWFLFRPASVPVETAKVSVGEMLVTIDGEGRTRFSDKVTVTAPVTGRMSRIRLREGDRLPKDYVITQIDPNPPQTRPTAETEGRINASAWKVYAPITGRLLKIWDQSERIITAGTPIIDIGNSDQTEIVVDVLSTDAVSIKPGATALIDQSGDGEHLQARVITIEPQAFTKISALGVEEQRVNIILDKVPPKLAVGDGYRVNLRIVVWQDTNVLQVPSSALFRVGAEWNVFVKDGNQAYLRPVVVGHINPSAAEVVVGLTEGDIVVLHPSNQLTDGARVHEE